jgi:hypothetical protein
MQNKLIPTDPSELEVFIPRLRKICVDCGFDEKEMAVVDKYLPAILRGDDPPTEGLDAEDQLTLTKLFVVMAARMESDIQYEPMPRYTPEEAANLAILLHRSGATDSEVKLFIKVAEAIAKGESMLLLDPDEAKAFYTVQTRLLDLNVRGMAGASGEVMEA